MALMKINAKMIKDIAVKIYCGILFLFYPQKGFI